MNKIFNFKKVILLTLMIAVLLISKYVFSKIMDSFSIGENEIVKKIDCPDNKYTAIAFIRDVGSTTSKSPQVSILKKGEKFTNNDIGNVFIGNKSNFIDIKWESNQTLILIYECEEFNVIKKESLVDKIAIKYMRKGYSSIKLK